MCEILQLESVNGTTFGICNKHTRYCHRLQASCRHQGPRYATVADNADIHSKSPASLGLPSIVQDCTDSVPPLIDADMSIVSRYMYSDCSLAGMHSVELIPLILCAPDRQ